MHMPSFCLEDILFMAFVKTSSSILFLLVDLIQELPSEALLFTDRLTGSMKLLTL